MYVLCISSTQPQCSTFYSVLIDLMTEQFILRISNEFNMEMLLLLLEITESFHLVKSRIRLACYVITCAMEIFFPLYLKSYLCLKP